MLGEATTLDPTDSDGAALGLPRLTPVPVVAEAEVDELVRSARAGVAMLSLRLRTALNDLAVAERGHPQVDLGQARDLARSSLDQHVLGRRRELADELEQARADAAFAVTAARTEAAELVAAATEETRQILLAGLGPLPSAPPGLRAVPDGLAGPGLPTHPSVHQLAESERGTRLAAAAVEAEVAALLSAPRPEPELEHEVAPNPDLRLDVPVQEVQARSATAPVAPMEVAVPATQAVDVGGDAPVPPQRGVSDQPASGNGTAAGIAPEQPAHRALSRFLYVDVVLPMIAVLIVLVVLLAWVG